MEVKVEHIKKRSFKGLKCHNKYALRALTMSVLHNDQTRPIIVRETGDGYYEIIDGQLLFDVAKKLHHKTVNVKTVGNIKLEEAIKIYLQHNIFNEHVDYIAYVKLLSSIKEDYSPSKMCDFLNMDIDDVHALLKLEKFDINSFSKIEDDNLQQTLF